METRSPRERVVRMLTMARRGCAYWKGSLIILLVAGAAAVAVAMSVRRVYRSECTVVAKPRIRTDDRDDPSTSPEAMVRQAARLKDMLTTRGRLESAVKKFHLYPETVARKTMLDAVEEMKPHVGFRSLEGAQYVISFDGWNPDTVKDVTRYLADTLIDDYAAGDLEDLRREADFLSAEEQRSVSGLEDATTAVTVFLAAHPELAIEVRQAAATPFGPGPAAGLPLIPKRGRAAQSLDPETAALVRERARLEGEARIAETTAAHGAAPAPVANRSLDEQIADAQAEQDAAVKRVADTQADLASKSDLTEDHPDMRAARLAADVAARQLHQARARLAALQQLASSGAPPPADPAAMPPEIAAKISAIDAQIAARRSETVRAHADATVPATTNASSPAVQLETDWQRLLRALGEARSHHDDLKMRVERAKLALEAARADANERMAMVDPPFRPTHPSKGGRTNTALAGLTMALLLAVAYATMRVTLADTVIDVEDVEALGVGPVLATVPRIAPLPMRKEARDDAA